MKRALVRISSQLLTKLLTKGNEISAKCTEGLPSDSRFVGMSYDAGYDTYVLVFEHESFGEAEDGELLPDIAIVYEKLK